MQVVGDIFVIIGTVFILFGVIGLMKFKNFYTRILVTAKIDTVGVITVIIGIAIKHGLSFFSMKVLLLMGIVMIVNPLASHMIARSAYLSGYQTEGQDDKAKTTYNEEHV
ncbi:MAG: monovalent cation/H(+) antiporter subunit G [Clostridia bacterium]|nr:monovalent cation/H(+) antiporter subunit G [Clostridia bacterium]